MSVRDPSDPIGSDETISATSAIGHSPTLTADRRGGLAATALGPGERVGRYVLGERLGAGGMGVVYRARDPDLGRDLAIKVVRPRLGGADARTRLLREAQAMARLRHRAVVPVFDVGAAGDEIFVVMPLLEGGTLGAWCRAAPRPWREVLARFLDAGAGLAAAHAAGLVHRDFKPDNVLLDRDGGVHVGDFGLARLDGEEPDAVRASSGPDLGSDGLTHTGALLGTPAYMAPEQLRGEPIDARSDQFSFCVALWEALHGARPFASPSSHTTTFAALIADIERGAIVEPPAGDVPPRLRAILRRGLASAPADRWPSMDALLGALRAATARRRWPWLVAGLGGAAAAIAIAVVARGGGEARRAAAPTPAADAGPATPWFRVLDKRRLTVQPGCEEFPSFTPDGKTLLYDGAAGDDYAIFAIDVDSGETRRLTHFDGWDYAPAMSPDGTRFAFIRDDPGAAVYVAPYPAGEPATKLVPGGFRPQWSTDPGYLWAGKSARPSRIEVATGTVERSVEAPPAMKAMIGVEGPDHQLIAAIFAESGQGMGVAILAPGAAPKIVEDGWFEEAVTRLPDGRGALVTRMTTGGTPVVVRVGWDGSVENLPVGEIVPRKGLTMTPDGRRVAWSTCKTEEDLAVLATAADGARRLDALVAGDWEDRDPTAVPGTTQVITASDRGGTPELWVVDTTGALPARRLPTDAVRAVGSAVSPDGRWVVYCSGVDGKMGLAAIPLDGSAPPRALTPTATDSAPGIGADGYVYFDRAVAADRWDILRVPLAGGDAETYLEQADSPEVSPDGTAMVFLRGKQAWVRDLATGKEQKLPDVFGRGYVRVAFSSDGAQIAMITNNLLTVVDRATGKVVLTHQTGTEQLTGLTFSGDRLLVSRLRWEGDLWLAETRVGR